jgi:hypothetical protein
LDHKTSGLINGKSPKLKSQKKERLGTFRCKDPFDIEIMREKTYKAFVFYTIFAQNFSMQVPNLSRHMVFVTVMNT